MAEGLNPKDTTTAEELLVTMIYTEEALINLLERKGILTKQEVLEEIKRVRVEQEKKGRSVSH